MENVISVTDFFAAAIRRGKRILICALVFALLMGALSAYRQIHAPRSNADGQETVDEEYQELMDLYESERSSLEAQMETAKNTLAVEQDYIANSLLMRMDPYNSYVTNIHFSVTDLSMPHGSVEDATLDYLISRVCNQYLLLWNSRDALSNLDVSSFDSIPQDTLPKYLRELITVTVEDGGMVSIVSRSASAADSLLLADTVYNYFLSQQPTIEKSACPHSISLITRSTLQSIDPDLAKLQKDNIDSISTTKTNIDKLDKQLSALVEPSPHSSTSLSGIAISIIKYMIVGAVLGAVLGCVAVWILDAFRGTAVSSYQIERIFSLDYMGSLSEDKNFFSKCANLLLKERIWENSEQACDYVIQQIKAQLGNCKQLLFVSTLDSEASDSLRCLMDKLQSDGISASYVSNINHNPASVAALATCDLVVLVESSIRSTAPAISDAVSLSDRTGKSIAGFILL